MVSVRPCPFTSCRHHLANGEGPAFARRRDTSETCSLDVASRGGATLDEVAGHLGMTHQRVQQIETRAIRKLRVLADADKYTARDALALLEATHA